MTSTQARAKAVELLESNASRSKICSFINDLEANVILDSGTCNSLADTLADDRSNGPYVLRKILQYMPQTEETDHAENAG